MLRSTGRLPGPIPDVMKSKISNTDDYLTALPNDQREALLKLRKQILTAAPGAEEHFGYGLPGFKLLGHPLIYMGAAKEHCALYGKMPAGFAEALKGFKQSKGSVHFTPAKPIPAALVKAIVKAKVMEQHARWGVKPDKKATAQAKTANRRMATRK
ncbi:MAG: DUF1801 domain-containing protein [Flavobacteriales bacterium]|nr:DUF1801 domain-containing protein [Flavobacteriales bacterium]